MLTPVCPAPSPPSPRAAGQRSAQAQGSLCVDERDASSIARAAGLAELLARLNLGASALVAGLLHGAVLSDDLSLADAAPLCATTRTLALLENVCKVSRLLAVLRAAGLASSSAAHGERFRRLLLALSPDPRAVFIVLAARVLELRDTQTDALAQAVQLPAAAGRRARSTPAERRALGREALELFAPLAHRLNMWALKSELEALGFALVRPRESLLLETEIGRLRTDCRPSLEHQRARLHAALAADPWLAASTTSLTVSARIKEPYSVWRKLTRARDSTDAVVATGAAERGAVASFGATVSSISLPPPTPVALASLADVLGLRVVFEAKPIPSGPDAPDLPDSPSSPPSRRGLPPSEPMRSQLASGRADGGGAVDPRAPPPTADGAAAAGAGAARDAAAAELERAIAQRIVSLTHAVWAPVAGRLKDYIAAPKHNGYRSVHTTVLWGSLKAEVQVRSAQMDFQSELGYAAHWIYKMPNQPPKPSPAADADADADVRPRAANAEPAAQAAAAARAAADGAGQTPPPPPLSDDVSVWLEAQQQCAREEKDEMVLQRAAAAAEERTAAAARLLAAAAAAMRAVAAAAARSRRKDEGGAADAEADALADRAEAAAMAAGVVSPTPTPMLVRAAADAAAGTGADEGADDGDGAAVAHTARLVRSVRKALLDKGVFIATLGGQVLALPQGATVADAARQMNCLDESGGGGAGEVGSGGGLEMRGIRATINGKPVSLLARLQTGDLLGVERAPPDPSAAVRGRAPRGPAHGWAFARADSALVESSQSAAIESDIAADARAAEPLDGWSGGRRPAVAEPRTQPRGGAAARAPELAERADTAASPTRAAGTASVPRAPAAQRDGASVTASAVTESLVTLPLFSGLRLSSPSAAWRARALSLLGFAKRSPSWLQDAELKHGRIAMLAAAHCALRAVVLAAAATPANDAAAFALTIPELPGFGAAAAAIMTAAESAAVEPHVRGLAAAAPTAPWTAWCILLCACGLAEGGQLARADSAKDALLPGGAAAAAARDGSVSARLAAIRAAGREPGVSPVAQRRAAEAREAATAATRQVETSAAAAALGALPTRADGRPSTQQVEVAAGRLAMLYMSALGLAIAATDVVAAGGGAHGAHG